MDLIIFIFPPPYRGGDSTWCRASCAVFYSDTRVPGAVFHSDTKFRQYIDISFPLTIHICIKSYSYFLPPIGAVTQLGVGHPARCFILTQGHLARCSILTQISDNILIFLTLLQFIFVLNYIHISSPPIGAETQLGVSHPAQC